jgi:Cu(I)/Ag(I) efflux system membrane protein CusA/SilA
MLSVPGPRRARLLLLRRLFVYVLFDDGTDLYWARSRVLEYLNQVQGRLPPGPSRRWGPTPPAWAGSTSTRWWTARASNDLAQLRSLQDWFLRFELKTLPNVAEVASRGRHGQAVPGRARSGQAGRLRHHAGAGARGARQARQPGNRRLGAGTGRGRIHGARQRLPARPWTTSAPSRWCTRGGVPVRLGDVATVQLGPEMRRGIAELDGEGEVAGGVVVLRSGKNAQQTIAAVKAKLAELQAACRRGGDRHHLRPLALIERAIDNLGFKLGRSSSWWRWSARCSCGTCARRWWPSSRCRWAS